MRIDRGFLVRKDGHWVLSGDQELPPRTVQGLIAARLDTLSADEKAVLQDASVIGAVAWVGAVAHVADRGRWAVEESLPACAETVRAA
jgi:hypothetical protein